MGTTSRLLSMPARLIGYKLVVSVYCTHRYTQYKILTFPILIPNYSSLLIHLVYQGCIWGWGWGWGGGGYAPRPLRLSVLMHTI